MSRARDQLVAVEFPLLNVKTQGNGQLMVFICSFIGDISLKMRAVFQIVIVE
jgi:hypothetical protein